MSEYDARMHLIDFKAMRVNRNIRSCSTSRYSLWPYCILRAV